MSFPVYDRVRAVLLVPNSGDPQGLLALGNGEVRRARKVDGEWRLSIGGDPAEALVLAWEGIEDEAACRRVFNISCPDGAEKTIGLVPGRPPLRKALHRALYAEWFGFGTAMLL